MAYKKKIEIDAPLKRVWDSWTTQEATQGWLSLRSNVDFREGGPYEFFWDDDPEKDSTKGCVLLEIAPRKRLSFEWQGKTEFLEMFKPPYGPTVVIVRFSRANERTVVEVEQQETRDMEKWSEYDEWMASAWEYALSSLKNYCEEKDRPVKENDSC